MEHQSDFVPIGEVCAARQRRGITLIKVVVCVGIIGLLIALLLPAVRTARGPARRNACINNLKQIALALHNYNDVYKAFPPAYTVDAEGKPLHSWRTLILPYIEEVALYKKIDLSKPWNDPANADAFKTEISAYRCPDLESPSEKGQTTYLAIVSPDGFFQCTEPRSLSDVTDKTSNTIMLVEAPIDRAVPWMAPQDADEKLLMAIGRDSKLSHPGIFLAAFVDGHVRSFESDLPADKRRALITIAADDPVDLDE
jgi:type II secretory pathway pseudopilin PulG